VKLAAGIRPLYLLALFQLVAGPLVLFCVMILCRETAREAADHGVVTAVSMAWKSPGFQAALATVERPDVSKRDCPDRDPKADPVKVKMPPIAWQDAPVVLVNASRRIPLLDAAQRWTPVLPLPPPGPPPRWG